MKGFLIFLGSVALGAVVGWKLHTHAAKAIYLSQQEIEHHSGNLAMAMHRQATYELYVKELMDGGMTREEAVDAANALKERRCEVIDFPA